MTRRAKARAHANIALIKYWGKRDVARNLPAVGSLSLTLQALHTETEVEFDTERDHFQLNGQPASEEARRVFRFLDRVRSLAGISARARVTSSNNFPTGAGLASSASGFAALALAAVRALGLSLSAAELSALTRVGSGSAPRSLWGGFVEMSMGQDPGGTDAVAHQLFDEHHWGLSVLAAITSEAPKRVSSSDAMKNSSDTSPFFSSWVEGSPRDLERARAAIARKDLVALGEIAEHNCLKMHGVTLSSRPPIVFWNGATLNVIHWVEAQRRRGVPVFYTIDAGPQVKVFCEVDRADALAVGLESVDGVSRVLRTGPGPGAHGC